MFLSSDSEETSPDGLGVIMLPDISASTVSSMLKCTLNQAVRMDTLSVNELQIMTILGKEKVADPRSCPWLNNLLTL